MDPFSPLEAQQRAYALNMLKDIHSQFIEAVRQGRGDRLKENDETFSGLVWTGEESITLGLADELGSVASVARDVVKAETIVNYSKRESLIERAARRVGASLGEAVMWSVRTQLQ
jgi:protease-4